MLGLLSLIACAMVPTAGASRKASGTDHSLMHDGFVLEDARPPKVPRDELSGKRPYLNTLARLPFVDIFEGPAHKMCDLTGHRLATPAGLRMAVNGKTYLLELPQNTEIGSLNETVHRSSSVTAYDMGTYRCVAYDNSDVGVPIPVAGVAKFSLLTDGTSTENGRRLLYPAELDSQNVELTYNLTGHVGPVVMSFSLGPQPRGEGDQFLVINQVVRVFIYPDPSAKDMSYRNGTAYVGAIEYMLPPEDSAMSSRVTVVTKSSTSITLFFPKKFDKSTPTHYSMTYGLPGNPVMPEPVQVAPDTEFEVNGLTPGLPYVFMFQIHTPHNVLNYTIEDQTLAARSNVIPAYSVVGDCMVYQEEVGYIVVRMPFRKAMDRPDYRLMSVHIKDSSSGEDFGTAKFDYPGDHRMQCPKCHHNGFTADIKCEEHHPKDPEQTGIAYTSEVSVKRTFGAPVELEPVPTEHFHPRVVRTSANAVVARLPKSLTRGGKAMRHVRLSFFKMATREQLLETEISEPGDTVVVVHGDHSDWHVELEWTDASGNSALYEFDNFCPPKYKSTMTERAFGPPRIKVTADGEVIVHVPERLSKNTPVATRNVMVLAHDAYMVGGSAIASATLGTHGALSLSTVPRTSSIGLDILVTTDDNRQHPFFTLLRRSAGSTNAPSSQSTPSVVSRTRTGFLFRVPPNLRIGGMPTLKSELKVYDTRRFKAVRERKMSGAGSYFVEDLEVFPFTAAVTAVGESTDGTEEGRQQQTFSYVSRVDGLNLFTNVGDVEVFFQRVNTDPPTQRIIIRVPFYVVDLPENSRLDKIAVLVSDGTTGPTFFTDEIRSRGDYVVPAVPLKPDIVVKMTLVTVEGDFVRKMVRLRDTWRRDFLMGYDIPTEIHPVGEARLFPQIGRAS